MMACLRLTPANTTFLQTVVNYKSQPIKHFSEDVKGIMITFAGSPRVILGTSKCNEEPRVQAVSMACRRRR